MHWVTDVVGAVLGVTGVGLLAAMALGLVTSGRELVSPLGRPPRPPRAGAPRPPGGGACSPPRGGGPPGGGWRGPAPAAPAPTPSCCSSTRPSTPAASA